MDMLTDEMYEVKKRADGRWIVVYGKDMPQAGKQWKGTKDYSTRELAIAAVKGQGRKETSYDRFMLDEEPDPVELEGGDGMLGDTGDDILGADEEDEEPEEVEKVAPKAKTADGKTIIVLVLNSKGMLND